MRLRKRRQADELSRIKREMVRRYEARYPECKGRVSVITNRNREPIAFCVLDKQDSQQ